MATEIVKEETVAAVDREKEARAVVQRYMFGNAAVGLIPLPIFDLVALTGVQIKMVHSLSNVYGVPFNKEAVKSAVMSLGGSLGSVVVGAGLFASVMKFIPFLTPAAALALPASAAAFTYAVGRTFIMHFEAGGNILNLKPEAMHTYFREFYQEGLTVAKQKADTDKTDAPKVDTTSESKSAKK